MDQNGPFWPKEVQFGPFRSANRTLAIPENRKKIAPEIGAEIGPAWKIGKK